MHLPSQVRCTSLGTPTPKAGDRLIPGAGNCTIPLGVRPTEVPRLPTESQLQETPLLNHPNYQTLIATKAARIRESGRGRLLPEFGLRRAHDKGANGPSSSG